MSTVNKKTRKPQENVEESREIDKNEQFVYASADTQNYDFADFVKVSSNPNAMLFSFGKSHPDLQGKRLIFSEIYLPLEIAWRLKNVLDRQFENLEQEGIIEIERHENNEKHSKKNK